MQRRTDKDLMVKGIKYMGIAFMLMFTAPLALYQAFKNEGHPFFWPVLIIGFVLAIGAIAMCFYSIKIIMDSLFGQKPKK